MKRKTNFKETEIGKIPEDWEVADLSSICSYINRGSPPSYTEKKEVLVLNQKCIRSIRIDFEEARFTDPVKKPIPDEKFLKSLDILVNSTGVGTLGRISQVKEIKRKITVDSHVTIIRPEKTKIYPEFLAYYLFYKKKEIENFAEGSTGQTELSRDKMKKMKAPIPKLAEQYTISKNLSDLDAKIELNRQTNATLENMAEALFKHWFVDFEFPNEQGKPYKSSGGKMVESELGEIPEGWEVKTIAECGEVICGKTPPTSDRENYGDNYLFITIPDMRDNTFVINTTTKLSETGAKTQKKKELPPLAVCVSCIATPGLVSLTSTKSHTNQQINSIVCNSEIDPHFMYLSMKLKSDDIKQMGLGGTATLNLNTGNFSKINLVMPPTVVMQRFSKIIEAQFALVLKNQSNIESLGLVRDSLLPKLMSGQIRVHTGVN